MEGAYLKQGPIKDMGRISFWETAECAKKSFDVCLERIKRLENGICVPGSFLAKTTCQAIVLKFKDKINRLKELCSVKERNTDLRTEPCEP